MSDSLGPVRQMIRSGRLDAERTRPVAEPDSAMHRVVDFVGLPWDDACARFHEDRRGVAIARWDQVNRPLNPTAVARDAQSVAQLGSLRTGLVDARKDDRP